jgi:serine/threonine protein kinase
MTNPWGLLALEHEGVIYELRSRIDEAPTDYISLIAVSNGETCVVRLVSRPTNGDYPRLIEGAFILRDLTDWAIVPILALFWLEFRHERLFAVVTPDFARAPYEIRSPLSPPPPLLVRLSWMLAMTDCVGYLHRSRCVHGKLELSAFAFPKGIESVAPVLVTFDSLKEERDSSDNLTHPGGDFPIGAEMAFIAPELRLSGTTTYQTDIYALGSTFFSVATGQPWNSHQLTLEERSAFLAPVRYSLGDDWADLIMGMTAEDPGKRLTIFGVRSHPLFNGISYTKPPNPWGACALTEATADRISHDSSHGFS